MKRFAGMAMGALIALVSIWAGAFFMHFLGWGHWAHFPAFITSALFMCVGVVVAVLHVGN